MGSGSCRDMDGEIVWAWRTAVEGYPFRAVLFGGVRVRSLEMQTQETQTDWEVSTFITHEPTQPSDSPGVGC